MQDGLSARFAFAKLVVQDIARQAIFYRSIMGYGAGHRIRGEIAGRPIEEIIFSAADGKPELILLAYADGASPSISGGAMIGFFTHDLDMFEGGLVAAGGTIMQAIGPLEGGSGPARMGLYADPEGFLLEVIEWENAARKARKQNTGTDG